MAERGPMNPNDDSGSASKTSSTIASKAREAGVTGAPVPSQADAVIVSAFGRGNWLASELASRGWQVTLVDVTESLGSWEPEDAEGPFGLMEASDLQPTQKTRLLEEGAMVTVESGLTLWLKDGPIECRSELTPYHLVNHGIGKVVETYLRKPGLADKESDRARQALAKAPFRETWLAHFAHQFVATAYAENHRGLETGESAVPIFAPFSIRQASSAGVQRGLKLCQSSGVKIRQKARVRDLRLMGRTVDVIEIQDERAGVESGRTFIWMLSSAESVRSTREVAKVLFPGGGLVPEWFWARFRVDFKGAADDDQFPAHVVMLEDPFLPWTHANAFVVRKRAEKKTYDAWVKLPARVREDREYFEKTGREVEALLAARLPLFDPKVVGLPLEARAGAEKAWPTPAPVFTPDQLRGLEILRLSNLFYCGPEHWSFLDWTGRYRTQNSILTRLERMRAQWLAQAAKEAARQASP